MAVIVVVTETAGGSTIGQALKMAAVFAFFSPILGAALPCVIIVIIRWLWPFLVLTGIMLVGLNIGAISDLATRVAPRLSVVTNFLDLMSLILVTPKLFDKITTLRNILTRCSVRQSFSCFSF
jgi:hypothetical protein